jgi:hypothetical protein
MYFDFILSFYGNIFCYFWVIGCKGHFVDEADVLPGFESFVVVE